MYRSTKLSFEFWFAVSICIATMCTDTLAQDLLQAPETAPKYKLENLRTERDMFGRSVLKFDYKIESPGPEWENRIAMAAKTDNSDLPTPILTSTPIKQSGVMELSFMRGIFGPSDCEICFVS